MYADIVALHASVVGDGLGLGAIVGFAVGLGDGEGEGDGLGLSVGDGLGLALGKALGDDVGHPRTEAVFRTAKSTASFARAVVVGLGLGLGLPLGDGEGVGSSEGVGLGAGEHVVFHNGWSVALLVVGHACTVTRTFRLGLGEPLAERSVTVTVHDPLATEVTQKVRLPENDVKRFGPTVQTAVSELAAAVNAL